MTPVSEVPALTVSKTPRKLATAIRVVSPNAARTASSAKAPGSPAYTTTRPSDCPFIAPESSAADLPGGSDRGRADAPGQRLGDEVDGLGKRHRGAPGQQRGSLGGVGDVRTAKALFHVRGDLCE